MVTSHITYTVRVLNQYDVVICYFSCKGIQYVENEK